jgi:translation initiation factor IF-1
VNIQEAYAISGSLVRGVVEEVLPKAMCRVRLHDGRLVRAGLSAASRRGIVRLIAGCQVEVKLSPYDPSRGQITRKL